MCHHTSRRSGSLASSRPTKGNSDHSSRGDVGNMTTSTRPASSSTSSSGSVVSDSECGSKAGERVGRQVGSTPQRKHPKCSVATGQSVFRQCQPGKSPCYIALFSCAPKTAQKQTSAWSVRRDNGLNFPRDRTEDSDNSSQGGSLKCERADGSSGSDGR